VNPPSPAERGRGRGKKPPPNLPKTSEAGLNVAQVADLR